MPAFKKLRLQLQKIQKNISLPHLSLPDLENLSLETKKILDDTIRRFAFRKNLIPKITVRRPNWRYLVSAPFIYAMIAPALIWNLFLEGYHQVCFRLYGIPRVDPRHYFLYDRQLMSLLTPWEKINCFYCSYVNNLIRYSAEIAGRTERYWCPIKYHRRIEKTHSQYPKFIDDAEKKNFRQNWSALRDFSDVKD